MENYFVNIFICLSVLLVGISFKFDIWNSEIVVGATMGITVDRILFKNVDKNLIKKANDMSAIICFFMAILIFINSTIVIFIDIPNISILFLLVAVIFSWPIRIVYIFIKG